MGTHGGEQRGVQAWSSRAGGCECRRGRAGEGRHGDWWGGRRRCRARRLPQIRGASGARRGDGAGREWEPPPRERRLGGESDGGGRRSGDVATGTTRGARNGCRRSAPSVCEAAGREGPRRGGATGLVGRKSAEARGGNAGKYDRDEAVAQVACEAPQERLRRSPETTGAKKCGKAPRAAPGARITPRT